MKPIDKLVSFVDDLTGNCPADVFGWEAKSGCANVCGSDGRGVPGDGRFAVPCWKEWALDRSAKLIDPLQTKASSGA